jgi:beta-glucosidase
MESDEERRAVVRDDTPTEPRRSANFRRQPVVGVQQALDLGCNIKCAMAWSPPNNFDWQMGDTMRFGLVFVAFANGQKRFPKSSYDGFREVAGTAIPA